jgi:hypothetical protein
MDIRKYTMYISVYTKIKTIEILKYDLSCMRYYIVIYELIIIFWLLNDLNKNVINYKVLDHVNLYNFDIKFNFIRDHMKKL